MGLLASSRGIRILLGCLLFIVPLVFFTDLTRNPYYTQIALFNVLVSLLWIGWLLHGFRAGQWCWRTTAVDHPLAVLLLVALLSLGWSWGGHPAMRTPIANEGLRNTLFLWLNWALVFWFVVQGLPEGWLRWSWRLIEWVAVLAAGYGVLQSLGIEPIWPQGLNPYGTRPVSTFGNPTFLGSTLAMVLPWLCARWLLAVPGWRRWGLGLMMGGCFAGLLVTLTRSSWTGAAVGVGWVAWAWWRSVKPSLWWRRFLWLGGVALLLTWFWPRSAGQGYHPTVRERLQEVAQVAHGTYGAWHQRLLIWRCGWHMVQERPLLGKGWGCFELFYPFYQGQYLDNPLFQGFRTHANNAHNLILEWWAQTGTLGLGIWCWLMLTVLIAGRNTAQRLPGEASLLAHGWLGGMLAMLVDNLLNVSLFFSVPALVFWWTAGSLFVSARDRLKTRCWSRSAPLAASVAGVLIFFFIWQGASDSWQPAGASNRRCLSIPSPKERSGHYPLSSFLYSSRRFLVQYKHQG
ncbi:MAG: O-antigen ligase family protein [Elusimicrobia bacterium]|nr:O-antigen ligase family protein [Elusimicrobiota bacterium]